MYDSLITNTSKSMMCFSDFPCPPDYPPYLPHQLYEQYLHSYAEHFKLHQHIRFNTKVRFCYFSWTLQQNFEQWTFTKMSDWPLWFIRVSFLLGLHCSQIQLLFHSVPTSLGDRNDCCQHGIADNATFWLPWPLLAVHCWCWWWLNLAHMWLHSPRLEVHGLEHCRHWNFMG